jgi:hypothetical protein
MSPNLQLGDKINYATKYSHKKTMEFTLSAKFILLNRYKKTPVKKDLGLSVTLSYIMLTFTII